MSKQSSDLEVSRKYEAPLPEVRALSREALARRRLLLRGTVGGATALAALTPVGALATNSQSTIYTCAVAGGKEALCTLSGVQSAAHSFAPGVVTTKAGGRSPGWWGQCDIVNKQKVPRRAWPVSTTLKVSSVLTSAPVDLGSLTLLELMSNSAYANKVERHWLCAYLNAKSSEQGGLAPYGFPYTSSQVVDFYLASNQGAYSFFTTYLENL